MARISLISFIRKMHSWQLMLSLTVRREEGYDGFIRADSIEELAEKLGIDADKLEETLDDYNDMCDEGYDAQFHKNMSISIRSQVREATW